MLERYSTNEMRKIWSQENKLNKWLEVEILTLEAFALKGKIPKSVASKVRKNAVINIDLMKKIEKETKHDVIAFTRMLSESLDEEKKWVHFGLTSTDVVDTAYGSLYKEANELILKQINNLLKILKRYAKKYSNTPCMGRTHGVHAEVTSLGLKFALWYEEIKRQKNRFILARKDVEKGKISGAVGNFANTKPYVQDYVCKKLKIESSKISTQVLQRDNHAFYYSVLALVGTTLEKIATEIRLLQRTEVAEIFEGFSSKQKGSSAMPHKKNPIGSENICGQSRLLRSYSQAAMENNNLWHERDISHSSVERIIAPNATSTLEYSLKRVCSILENIVVDKQKMLKNIWLTNGSIFSQKAMLFLIENKKISREKAYDLIQGLIHEANKTNTPLKKLLINNKDINLTKNEIENIFDIKFYLNEVKTILKRVGIK